jgi:hypothetical protein
MQRTHLHQLALLDDHRLPYPIGEAGIFNSGAVESPIDDARNSGRL